MAKRLKHGDNLDIMRGMDSECVDLIYLDPPFNSNREYVASIDSETVGFRDVWMSYDTDKSRYREIARRKGPVYKVIRLSKLTHSESMKAYLTMMAVRLLEMRRILKPTGSIYLHCDPTASHYLKLLMDAVFGKKSFQNEIVWGYEKPRSSKRVWRRNHDILLFYAKSDKWTFNPQRVPLMDGSFKMRKPFKRPDGSIWKPKEPGKQAGSWWYDIPSFATRMTASERTGYPTQKPLKLLERIIQASSNEGDLVFDPFCGSGTTLVAAKRLSRKWLGIDSEISAIKLSSKRIKSLDL